MEAPGFDNSPRGIQVSLQVIGVVGPRVFSYTPHTGAPEITSVSLRPSDTAEEAIARLLGMGASGAPVVDAEGRPLGVVSFRDLLPRCGGPLVMHRMTAPAVTSPRNGNVPWGASMVP